METKTITTIDDKVLKAEKFLPLSYIPDYFAVAEGNLYVKRGNKYQLAEKTYISTD